MKKLQAALQKVIRLLHEDKQFSNMHFTLSTENYAMLLMVPELIDSLDLGNGNGNKFSLEEPNDTSVEKAIEEYCDKIKFMNRCHMVDICLDGLRRFLKYVRKRFAGKDIKLSNSTITKIKETGFYNKITKYLAEEQ